METGQRKFGKTLLPTKNYMQVALIEIMLIFSVLLMGDIAAALGSSSAGSAVSMALLIPEAVYVFILFRLTTLLTDNRIMQRIVAVLLVAAAILSVIGLLPLMSGDESKSHVLIAVHLILCFIECYLIALGLQDIYIDKLTLRERLWGSVAMYLLIAIGWASFYEIFLLTDHTLFGVELIPGYQTYSEALYYSLCSLSGTGSIYANPNHLIRNLSLIESVWGVLFLVMLIGRVFTVSDKEE